MRRFVVTAVGDLYKKPAVFTEKIFGTVIGEGEYQLGHGS
ncbi:hypothetical protein OROHE_000942 [Orobanche hederae]